MKSLLFFLTGISLSYGATFTVTSNLDAGAGTLREAITLANGSAGADNIDFALGGPSTITLASCLPAITEQVTINGYTNAGSIPGTPNVTIQASCLNGFEFAAGSNGSILRGVILYGANRGIYLINSSNHTIQGNFIGTNSTGMAVAPAVIAWNGIEIDQSSNNLIGGNPLLGEHNLISGCNEQAIRIQGASNNNIIRGNLMGTNVLGSAAIPNGQNAVFQIGNSSGTLIELNLMSGNGQRAVFSDNCPSPIIQNNFIGTTIDGNSPIGNGQFGIQVIANSHNPQILNNVICNSAFHGIAIDNCLRPIVKGNKVGVGFNGTAVMGNNEHGIMMINCLRPTIGGALAGEGNFSSNNRFVGIRVENCDSVRIKGNFVGLDATGTVDRGNSEHGINITNCRNPIIGGTTLLERNYISGNNIHGITINGAVCDKAYIKGNVIGLGTDLTTELGNNAHGIEIIECEDSYIGGTTAAERNYISKNGAHGISMIIACHNSVIAGNFVGVDGTGLVAKGNGATGIRVESCDNVVIGGTTYAHRNISSGNNDNGIVIDGTSTNCQVKANFAGLGVDGSTAIPNGFTGIYLLGTSSGIIVGGSTHAERNVSSSNGLRTLTGDGIRIEGPDGNTILGNYCGADSTGTIARPNHWGGISMNESDNNIVGGTGLHEGNIVSANLNEGFYLRNANNNTIIGNYVGTDKTGSLQLGNEDWGVNISPAGPNLDNIIGGSLANRNIIAYNRNVPGNGGRGIYVYNNSHRNLFTHNAIYCNENVGIEVNSPGNEGILAPVITSSLTNTVSGTAAAGNTIHIYRNVNVSAGAWCDCEGEIFVGTTVADGAGNWSFTHNLGLTVGEANAVSATQTNATNSTSAFSTCSSPLPVNFLSFDVKRTGTSEATISWATSSETNNDHFVVLRSLDGIHFEAIGTIDGNGNSSTVQDYQFIDTDVPDAQVVYYRLEQVDMNGESSLTIIKSISGSGQTFVAFVQQQVLSVGVLSESTVTIRVLTSTGQLILEERISGQGWIEKDIPLHGISEGIYVVQLQSASVSETIKVMAQ